MLRFDDQFPLHRKVDGLSDSAFRLHVESIFWCARNLTDGFIAQIDIASVSRFRKAQGYVAELVQRGAWHQITKGEIVGGCLRCEQREDRDDLPPDSNGWLIHDFLDWQLPRSKVLQIKERRAEAGRRGGIRSAYVRNEQKNKSQRDKRRGVTTGQGPPASKSQATSKQIASRADEPPIPSPSKEGNGGERHATHGAALSPEKVNGNGGKPPPEAAALLAELRADLAKPKRRNRTASTEAAP